MLCLSGGQTRFGLGHLTGMALLLQLTGTAEEKHLPLLSYCRLADTSRAHYASVHKLQCSPAAGAIHQSQCTAQQ